ncbi:transglycosylase domain-containing protein [Lysobacter sp. CA199]|uniref:transglycosylase domain-containing protein n=1 Tax=Lysobacter sp. CA199 TaxID=3455608 RepID=UPI003F8D6DC9
MDVLLKYIAGVLVVLATLLLALIYGLYWYGLRGIPEQLPQAQRAYSEPLRQLYWTLEVGGTGPIEVRPSNPVGFVIDTLTEPNGNTRALAGRLLRDRVASHLQMRLLPQRRRISLWHLTNAALSIRLSRERSGEQLIDYALEQASFGIDENGAPVRGIDAAAKRYFAQPVEALQTRELIALLVAMRGKSHDPACEPGRFARRYALLVDSAGLALDALRPPANMRIGVCRPRS